MSSSELFSKNLQLLGRHTPIGPLVFAHLQDDTCAFLNNPDGTLNLTVDDVPIYPSEGIAQEAAAHFAKLDLEGARVLFLFGVGLGYDFDAASTWLDEDRSRYLVFLEDDVGVAKKFLSTEQATRVLGHKRVRLHFFTPPARGNEMLIQLSRYYALCPIAIGTLDFYQKTRSELCLEVEATLAVESYQQQVVASQALDQNHHFYRTLYPNLRAMGSDLLAEDLFGSFPKTPAIICGAGPSLNQALPHLSALKTQALVFAGGSALTALGAAGVAPHFGAGLSPAISERDRFERTNLFSTPLLYSPRICPEALSAWGGDRIACLSGGEPLVTWIGKELGLEGIALEEGPSVIGLLLELAFRMGCDPIIFVGVDLSAEGEALYAAGVEPLETQHLEPFKWLAEGERLSKMCLERPGPAYLNASPHPSIPHIPQATLQALDLFPKRDLSSLVLSTLEGIRRPLYQKRVDHLLKGLQESLERCLILLGEMADELASVEKEVVSAAIKLGRQMTHSFGRKGGATFSEVPPHLSRGKLALLQVELDEELAYRLVLEGMVQSRATYLQRVYDEFLAPAKGTPQLLWQRKVTLEQEKVQFLQGAIQGQLSLLSS